MPILSTFYGMIIRVFHNDHNPPHIHVQYAEMKAIFEIRTGKMIDGKVPPRLQKLIKEWLALNQVEILTAWNIAQQQKIPKRVKPLE